MVAGNAERVREVGAVEFVPQIQLDDLALTRVETCDRGADEFAQFGALRTGANIGRLVGHVAGLVQPGRGAGPQPAVALVPCHGVQPRPEAFAITEAADLGRGDDERVLDGVGGVGGLGEQ